MSPNRHNRRILLSSINHSALVLPSLLAFACVTVEPAREQSNLEHADATTEGYDNPRSGNREQDAAANDLDTALGTSHAATITQPPASERGDAGVAASASTVTVSTAAASTGSESSTALTTANSSDTAQPTTSQPTTAQPTTAQPTSPQNVDPIVWEACGPGKCASIPVPVDYDEPTAETLGLRVFVGPAIAERRGVVYYNPGGPGMPVVANERYLSLYEGLSALMPTMDIVLIDNRGIGESQPLNCISEAALTAQVGEPSVSTDLEEFEAYGDYWRAWNDACVETLGENMLGNLHTANVARDMDRVREVLGEDQINLWMVSYGTVQASVYAALFPERVRAFVLDSPAYVGQTTIVDDVVDTITAYEHELSRFLDWCALKDTCGLGTSKLEVDRNYDALIAELEAGVSVGDATLDPYSLSYAANELLRYGEWDTFAEILRDLAAGYWQPLVSEESSREDEELAWQGNQASSIYRLMDYGCPASFSAQAALALETEMRERAPRFAPAFRGLLAQCVGWYTRPNEQRVLTKELPSAPLLIVTSVHDAATPLEGAEALQEEFNNGTLLYVSNKEGHGVLSADVDAAVVGADYIMTGRMSAFCDQLPCQSVGETELDLTSLRVLSKPVAGLQRLPELHTPPNLKSLRP